MTVEVLEFLTLILLNMEYKKLSKEYDMLFDNYVLTELMLRKQNGRKTIIGNNSTVHLLLTEKLKEYGLHLFGLFEKDNMQFKSVQLPKDFPIENEPILKQLYGYTNFIAHIQLEGFDDFSTAFDYHTETGGCELQRHCFGTVTDRIFYDSLSYMLEDINNRTYEEIFKL